MAFAADVLAWGWGRRVLLEFLLLFADPARLLVYDLFHLFGRSPARCANDHAPVGMNRYAQRLALGENELIFDSHGVVGDGVEGHLALIINENCRLCTLYCCLTSGRLEAGATSVCCCYTTGWRRRKSRVGAAMPTARAANINAVVSKLGSSSCMTIRSMGVTLPMLMMPAICRMSSMAR